MNREDEENNVVLDTNQNYKRRCYEEYSCVEDVYYFINLSLPFSN